MNLVISLKVFQSVLGDPALPDFSPNEPFQAGLLLEGYDNTVGIELLTRLPGGDADDVSVQARTLNESGHPPIAEGTEFFLTRSGKMLGRGRIETINSD